MNAKSVLSFVLFLFLCSLSNGQATYRWSHPPLAFSNPTVDYYSPTKRVDHFNIPASDGGFLTGGYLGVHPYAAHRPVLISKRDRTGATEWTLILEDDTYPSESIYLTHAVESPGQGYYVLGRFRHNPSTATLPQSGIVCFIDYGGSLQWTKLFHENVIGALSERQELYKGMVDDYGNLIAVGVDYDGYLSQGWFSKIDPSGGLIQSERVFYTNGNVALLDISSAEPDECIALGANPNAHIHLVHLTNGCENMDWDTFTAFSLNSVLQPKAISYDPSSKGYFICGGVGLSPSISGFVAYADEKGIMKWVKQVNGNHSNTFLSDIVVYEENAYVVGATFDGTLWQDVEGVMASFDVNGNITFDKRLSHSSHPDELLFLNSIELVPNAVNPTQFYYFQIGGISMIPGGTQPDQLVSHLVHTVSLEDDCSVDPANLTTVSIPFTSVSRPLSTANVIDIHPFNLDEDHWGSMAEDHCSILPAKRGANVEDARVLPTPPVGSGYRGIAYPNPTSNAFMFDLPEEDLPATVRLISTNGQVVINATFSHEQNELSVAELIPGIYYLDIQGQQKHYYEKVIIKE